jgi:PPOX class probable F420-dependent enzyme
MSNVIPDSHLDLISGPIIATFTTVSPDGKPENTAVWCSWDGTHILVNTKIGRRKERNIRNNPNVALFVLDPESAFRWIDIRGVVEEIIPDADYANINAHAKLYAGVDEYYGGFAPIERKGTEERIVYKIKPQQVVEYPHKTHQ